MGAGQPTKYKKQYCKMLVDYMTRGKSYAAFAAELNVHRDTLYEWESKHKEFSDAKKLGKAKALRYWEDVLNDGAQGLPCNPTLLIFLLKCRFRDEGYRDKFEDDPPDINLKISSSVDREVAQLSAKEAMKLLIEERKKK